ncbi:Uncharacterized protein TCM_027047 [Theobroma cacao]|uniref:Uncharacterized protein n=1 Tax=Theobroma cacao TaxID=3641 RepID=A0A061GF84_THECC|nr:Uncharacterized protein TCM_027047 [Theobroma cacao]
MVTVAVASNRQVILRLDGRSTSFVFICMPIMPFSKTLPDPLPVLARTFGETPRTILGLFQLGLRWSLRLEQRC